MGKVTIRDVAKAAGVSTATVSNALNNAEVINPETKKRVLQIAKELNYVPNLSGRMLKAGKSNMIGFVSSSLTGPYFSKLVEVMQEECEANGYGLMLIYTQTPQIIRNYVYGGGVDGVFVYEGEERFEKSEAAHMESQKIKGIFLDRDYSGSCVGSITFDSVRSGYLLTKQIIELGHKDILFIKGPDDVQDSVDRKKGFLEAMKEAGLETGESAVIHGNFTEEGAFQAIMQMAEEGRKMPSAFIAGNDSSAMGCIRALKELGYSVPEDISVAGFDDIELARYFDPPISTLHLPVEEQARMGVRMMLKLIANEPVESPCVKLTGDIVIRKSTRAV